MSRAAGAAISLVALLVSGITPASERPPALERLPPLDKFCLAAQRIVTRTDYPMRLVINESFDAFVSSKAVIEGPTIQQFLWRDAAGRLLGVSCKLKSADHLNMSFGPDTAGGDGLCQDFNRAIYARVAAQVTEPAFSSVIFDPRETVANEDQPGMTGPDWLAPFTLSYVDDDGALHIATKGFVVNFSDPQFAKAPARFRGVHYCHFVAPDYLRALLAGEARAGVRIGREVDPSRPMPTE